MIHVIATGAHMTADQAKALAHYAPMALEASRPTWDTLPTIIRHLPDAWSDEQMQMVISALVNKIDDSKGGKGYASCLDGLLEAHEALEDRRSEFDLAADREAAEADRKRWERKERDL